MTLCLLIMNGCPRRAPATVTEIEPEVPKPPAIKPVVNVYVENTASMDGFVNGPTDFKIAVYGYLADMQVANIAESINLFYINNKTTMFNGDIRDFIERLDPKTFASRRQLNVDTDIANVMKMIVDDMDEHTLSILAADCIFSAGSNKSSAEYLGNQQIGIFRNIAEHITKYPNTAFVIYRLTSQFDGRYFNRDNKAQVIQKGRLPYFMWIIGNVDDIATFKEKIPQAHFKGSGITHSYTLLPMVHEVNYAVQHTPKIGNFNFGKTRKHIVKPKKETKRGGNQGKFMFSIGVNFSNLQTLLGNDYICNPDNYSLTVNRQLSDAFDLEIVENKGKTSYSHILKLSTTDRIPTGDVEITLINKVPEWIDEKNDEIGLDILAPDAMDKTYGIKNMIAGIVDAYNRVFKETQETHQPYAKINVNISNR